MNEKLPHRHDDGTIHVQGDAAPGHTHAHSHAHQHHDARFRAVE